jgi:hypothetical protein
LGNKHIQQQVLILGWHLRALHLYLLLPLVGALVVAEIGLVTKVEAVAAVRLLTETTYPLLPEIHTV